MACLMAAVFVAALDVTIIVTALPTISPYVLTYNTSSPLWGSLSDIFGRKPVLLSGIAIFFIGSLMCGAAPSLSILLAGRAVQGLGGAGCIVLVNICVSDLFSLRDRGFYFGLIGVMWALASGIGPVIGGVFTQSLSTYHRARFCTLVVHSKATQPTNANSRGPSNNRLVMILLGLNFGGSTYPWSSATVICLIIFGASTFGHYIPAVYLGIILTPLGIGLFITFPPATNWIKLIIFQIIGAVGLGLNFEGPLLALQAVVGNKDVAMATATFGFVRSMSNAFSIVIGGVVFANVMARQRPQLGRVLGDDIAEQLAGDAAANIGVIDGLSESEKVVVKMALLKAVKAMWILVTTLK
ncbi:putative Uncharacterized MFS-type transporter [Glarea lozoyensis 74030]|uniref:Putative Uncharacterized MFS-type transporter n=1 Tax=Glarea lozoyensis (strain ATCC 74030 / MF5533) TaxID=1104152 RepID=H0EQ37_GLAL7|nr:putative Uncharacterized MFS-type transporter [Glarea lozoyensis 74030]